MVCHRGAGVRCTMNPLEIHGPALTHKVSTSSHGQSKSSSILGTVLISGWDSDDESMSGDVNQWNRAHRYSGHSSTTVLGQARAIENVKLISLRGVSDPLRGNPFALIERRVRGTVAGTFGETARRRTAKVARLVKVLSTLFASAVLQSVLQGRTPICITDNLNLTDAETQSCCEAIHKLASCAEIVGNGRSVKCKNRSTWLFFSDGYRDSLLEVHLEFLVMESPHICLFLFLVLSTPMAERLAQVSLCA